MRKILYLISIVTTALFLCGFVAGEEVEKAKDKAKKQAVQTTPVLEYQETIAPQKTNQELYQQYHLLAVSSLEEAESSFQENKLWTFRMVQNAVNYTKLLQELVMDAQKKEYTPILERLNPLLTDLKQRSIDRSKTEKIKAELSSVAKTLEQDYSWEKVKAWIKE
jgi:hypothetical protein